MVQVPGGYCIDSTEVTNAQYQAFLTAKGADTSGQDPWCSSWNTTYAPSTTAAAYGCTTGTFDFTNKPNYPVVCVDWCDAYAFCKWANKRLCGKIGGGPTAWADWANSQWYAACSAGGTLTYPYGNTYAGLKCVGPDYDGVPGYESTDVPQAVGAATSCQGSGAYAGIYDLSGNVWEWEDMCNAPGGASDSCGFRGGAFFVQDATWLRCNHAGYDTRSATSRQFGFRCCAL